MAVAQSVEPLVVVQVVVGSSPIRHLALRPRSAWPRSSADRATDFESVCGGSTPPGAIAAQNLAPLRGASIFGGELGIKCSWAGTGEARPRVLEADAERWRSGTRRKVRHSAEPTKVSVAAADRFGGLALHRHPRRERDLPFSRPRRDRGPRAGCRSAGLGLRIRRTLFDSRGPACER